jgi:hypothetical protein
MDAEIVEGTAKDIIARLARLPADEHVRVVIGRPSLSTVARKTQAIAAAHGMTDEIHDALIRSLNDDP